MGWAGGSLVSEGAVHKHMHGDLFLVPFRWRGPAVLFRRSSEVVGDADSLALEGAAFSQAPEFIPCTFPVAGAFFLGPPLGETIEFDRSGGYKIQVSRVMSRVGAGCGPPGYSIKKSV